MPIKILDVPDPYSLAARAKPEASPLIQSDAFRQLTQELRRYCAGELSGRSFLIAGHRGAGKTTLVSSAFETILREQIAPTGFTNVTPTRAFRPLPVLLQGPTLLPSPNEDLPFAIDGTGDAGRRLSEMENVLVQITLALHKALAREMVLAFRAHVARISPSPDDRPPWLRDSPSEAIARRRSPEMNELVSQLELELDEYSGKARLRDLWRRIGVLQTGVIGALTYWPPATNGEQGMRELVALASMSDAYRRISGRISRKDSNTMGASSKTSVGVEVSGTGKDLTAPLLTLLSGAAVTTGLLAGKVETPYAALGGVLTALAGMFVVKASATRSRDRSVALEDLFIPDLSVATMDRILPVLIERLRDAGLAPVFVIDELDKVEGLSSRILGMIRRLKKMVAENAFFCFLADRSYFEEMRQRTANAPYSIEHTYFTHQLFIAFRHADMRHYLSEVLVKPADADPNDMRMATQVKEEQADHAVLPYVLLHNAQMHTIDLQRHIAQMRNADGNVILAPGVVRSKPRFQLELLVQLAIELQLEQESMHEELDRRPAFRRLAHDAMFYISREWEKDDPTLSLADAALPKFENYLVGRMALETPVPATPVKYGVATSGQPFTIGAAPPTPPPTQAPPMISAEDLAFLWSAVRTLAESLASPATIEVEYDKRKLPEVILAAVREAVKLGPLLQRGAAAYEYSWMFRRSGRRAPQAQPQPQPRPAAVPPSTAVSPVTTVTPVPPPVPPVPPPVVPPVGVAPSGPWQTQILDIRKFDETIKTLTLGRIDPSALSAGLGILPTSPAWPHVASAMGRLDSLSADKATYPEFDDDVRVIDAYTHMLRANVEAVGLALFCGLLVANWVGGVVWPALENLSQVLRLHELNPRYVREALRFLAEDLDRELTSLKAYQGPTPLKEGSFADWLSWIGTLPPKIAVDIDRVSRQQRPSTWQYWTARMQGTSVSVDADIALAAVTGTGAFKFIKLPLDSMTLRDWSVAFHAGLISREVPGWVATVALRRLGWDVKPSRFVESMVTQLAANPEENALLMYASLSWPGAGSPSRTAGRAVIESQPESLSESWKPEPSSAALILRPHEWSAVLKVWSTDRLATMDALGPLLAAVDSSAPKSAPAGRKRLRGDMPPSAGPSADFEEFFLSKPSDNAQPVWITADPDESVPTPFRGVVRPKAVQDLFPSRQPSRLS